MGIFPKKFPKKILEDQLNITAAAYGKIGYGYKRSSLAKFAKENQLSPKQIELTFKKFQDKILPQVIKWLGLRVDLKYKIKFVDVDAYWESWISTNNNGDILLQYNLNRRHSWTRGLTEYLVFHELCAHALQALSWQKQIRRGRLNPFIGLTTCFSPEQFLMEGIAEALFYFYPSNPFSNFGLAALHSAHLYWLVMNNAHIMANAGTPTNQIVLFVKKYLPAYSAVEIRHNLRERVEDPLFRTYQYVYGAALYAQRQIASQLTAEQCRKYVLDIFQHVYTPQEILDKYRVKL